jgi:oligopeptide/dipeptide ABC transporter ATP-binding protein
VSDAVLSTRAVRKTYRLKTGMLTQLVGGQTHAVRAVDGVDLRLAVGEVLALVGESGCGKSTLGRLLAALEPPTEGEVAYRGRPVHALRGADARDFRRNVQMIFQNPYESLDPRMTVGSAVSEPLHIHRVGSARDRRGRALEMLQMVGLSPARDFYDRLPHELSGGQRQRVAVARAMVLQPQVIIADEPVSMLDASIRSGIMNLMLDLKEARAVSYVFITHDLAVARYVASRVAVMYLGALVEAGPVDDVLGRAAHPYTRALLAAVPTLQPGTGRSRVRLPGEAAESKAIPAGCRFHPRCPLAREICRTDPPPLAAVGPDHTAACHFAADVLNGTLQAVPRRNAVQAREVQM